MAKNDKQEKEKPLEKMTAKELRELSLTVEGVVGVHAMNKAELITVIKQAKGIVDKKPRKAGSDVRSLKARIKAFREKKLQAKEAGNVKLADAFRRRIGNLKKKTRRAAV